MMRHATQLLARLDNRIVVILMLLLASLLVFESWMLVIRKPLTEYRQLRTLRSALAESVTQSPQQLAEQGQLASELNGLMQRLSGQLRLRASDDEMAASLMAALDQSAARFGVVLSSVKPGARKPVSVFEELTFEVGGAGSYLQLCQWMLDFEQTMGGSATITEFNMQAANEAARATLSFNIALYRPLQLVEGSL